jgi:hypothetical protein
VALYRTAFLDPNIYDEGLSVVGAMRVLAGERPHRDFWTVYPPGMLMLLAAAFKTFGASLLVERCLTLLIGAGCVGLAYRVVEGAGRAWALWGAGIMLFWLSALSFFASAAVAALALGLAAILCIGRHLQTCRRRSLVASIAFTVVAAVFRHDFGLYFFAAIAAALIVAWCLAGRHPSGDLDLLQSCWQYVGGVGAATAVAVTTIVVLGGTDNVYDQLIRFPLTVFPAVRDLPYPSALAAAAPPLIGAAALLAASLTGRSLAPSACVRILAPAIAGLLLINQSRVRSDLFHVFPSFVLAALAVAAVGGSLATSGRKGATRAFVVLAVAITVASGQMLPLVSAKAGYVFTLPRAAGLLAITDQSVYESAIRAVQSMTRTGEPIFVGSDRHDRIFINDMMFYFLADRPSATRYHELHPGVATTADVQAAIVAELRRRNVSVVVLRSEVHPPEPANASSRSSGVVALDEFIRAEFRPGEAFGNYRIWRRR